MIVVCEDSSSDRILSNFFANTLYSITVTNALDAVYDRVCLGHADIVLLSESMVLNSCHTDLSKIVKKIKKYASSNNLYIPVIAVLGNNTDFCEDDFYDIPIDDFLRTDFSDGALFFCLKRFFTIKNLFDDAVSNRFFLEKNLNHYLDQGHIGLAKSISEINILTIELPAPLLNRLKSVGFNVLKNLTKSDLKKFDINKQEIDCLVLDYNQFPKKIREYSDFLDKRPKYLPILMVYNNFNENIDVALNMNDCGGFCLKHSNLELQKRIIGLSLYREIRNGLYDYLFKNLGLALRDPLTGVYNRRFIDNYFVGISNFKYSDKGTCICLIDVDNFKLVNDRYGHTIGDVVLKYLSTIITKSVRDTDFVCRYGGDEFILIMPNITLGEAEKIAQRIKDNTLSRDFCDGLDIGLSVSFGISRYFPNADIQQAIENADKELSKHKLLHRKGRG